MWHSVALVSAIEAQMSLCALCMTVCLSYLRDLSQLFTLLIHSSLQQHVVHHPHQLDHFQSATGPPGHTEYTHKSTQLRTFFDNIHPFSYQNFSYLMVHSTNSSYKYALYHYDFRKQNLPLKTARVSVKLINSYFGAHSEGKTRNFCSSSCSCTVNALRNRSNMTVNRKTQFENENKRVNMNKVDEHNGADSLLIELKTFQPFVFHNVKFFWNQIL